jgi:hypothetical protein
MRTVALVLVGAACGGRQPPAHDRDLLGRCYAVPEGFWGWLPASNTPVPVAIYLQDPREKPDAHDPETPVPKGTVLELVGEWHGGDYVYGLLLAHDRQLSADLWTISLAQYSDGHATLDAAQGYFLRHAHEVDCGPSWWTRARFDQFQADGVKLQPGFSLAPYTLPPR